MHIIRSLIVAAIMLSGCSTYSSHETDLSQLKPEHRLVMDTRACDGVWICGPWVKIHPATVWRDKHGELHDEPESLNMGLESALSDPLSKGAEMLTVPVK